MVYVANNYNYEVSTAALIIATLGKAKQNCRGHPSPFIILLQLNKFGVLATPWQPLVLKGSVQRDLRGVKSGINR